jgi:hypothetical protein
MRWKLRREMNSVGASLEEPFSGDNMYSTPTTANQAIIEPLKRPPLKDGQSVEV